MSNLMALMVYPEKAVMEIDDADFPQSETTISSPPATTLLGNDGQLPTFVLEILFRDPNEAIRFLVVRYRNIRFCDHN